MKNVKIKKLTLSNWRTQNRTIEFNDHTRISGRNGSGKSSVLDAINWLFTGYDAQDRANYQLFDNKVEPTKENSLPASVEIELDIDGTTYALKRIAIMGWVRPRGSDEYIKKPSDDYAYEIDGVNCSVSAFNKFIEETFCPQDKLKFILNIDHFLGMEWKELRKHFADIIGEVQREEYNGDFNDAFALIDRYGSIERAKEFVKSQINPLKKSIGNGVEKGEKDIELETLESNLVDVFDYTEAELEKEKIEKDIDSIDHQIADKNKAYDNAYEERNQRMMDVRNEEEKYRKEEDEYNRNHERELNLLVSERSEIERENDKIKRESEAIPRYEKDCKERIAKCNEMLDNYAKRHQELTEEALAIKNREFNPSEATCPYCGAQLDGEKLEEAEKRFDEKKEKDYAIKIEEGKANRRDWNICLSRKEQYDKELDSYQQVRGLISTIEVDRKISDLKNSFVPFKETIKAKEILSQIEQYKALVVDVPVVDTSDLLEKKRALREELNGVITTLANRTIYESQLEKIDALKKEIKKTAIELAKLEGLFAKFDEIEKQKAEIVRRKVAKYFNVCEVEMEERKKDGNMTPCCNIVIKGVKAQVTNTANKILAGADISNAFSLYYGLNMPLIIDNRERVDDSVEFGGNGRQVIELKVDDCDFNVA